eukprot:TRINITY_DN5323_c0_g1_i1.p1 TRINITY_DN5323_c0_g1~~TRINITY_DN5323_c0_g1_i1.p1  ORF type:complete len:583 (-),score=84.03 TRINITY_DN5323_c0_g1_i1:132-1880(-)
MEADATLYALHWLPCAHRLALACVNKSFNAAAMASLQAAQVLDLTSAGDGVTDDALVDTVLHRCGPHLRGIQVKSTKVTDAAIQEVIRSIGSRLMVLHLGGCSSVHHPDTLSAIATHCVNGTLTSLDISGCGQVSPNLTEFTTIRSHLPAVARNAFFVHAFLDTHIEHLVSHVGKGLRVFRLGDCLAVTSRGIRAVLQGCPCLQELVVGSTKPVDLLSGASMCHLHRRITDALFVGITDEVQAPVDQPQEQQHNQQQQQQQQAQQQPPQQLQLQQQPQPGAVQTERPANLNTLTALSVRGCAQISIAALRGLPSQAMGLLSLDVAGVPTVTDDALALAAAAWPTLTDLNISVCTGVSDSGLKAISCLPLTSLAAHAVSVTDAGVRALLRHNMPLQSCNLSLTAITIRSVRSIAALETVRSANVRCCAGLVGSSAQAIAALHTTIQKRGGRGIIGLEALPHNQMDTHGSCGGADGTVAGGSNANASGSSSQLVTRGNKVFDWNAVPRGLGARGLAAWAGFRGLSGDVLRAVVMSMHPFAQVSFVPRTTAGTRSTSVQGGFAVHLSQYSAAWVTCEVDEDGFVA